MKRFLRVAVLTLLVATPIIGWYLRSLGAERRRQEYYETISAMTTESMRHHRIAMQQGVNDPSAYGQMWRAIEKDRTKHPILRSPKPD